MAFKNQSPSVPDNVGHRSVVTVHDPSNCGPTKKRMHAVVGPSIGGAPHGRLSVAIESQASMCIERIY